MSARPRPRGRHTRLALLALLAALAASAAMVVPAPPASAGATTTTCAQIVALAARGTVEPAGTGTGPLGIYTYGRLEVAQLGHASGGLGTLEPVINELKATPRIQVRSAGLNYPAWWEESVGLQVGVDRLQLELNALAGQCPYSRTVLLGYSQGAAVIGNLLSNEIRLTLTARNNIAVVTFYGDPGYRREYLFNDPHNTSDGPGIRYRAAGELNWIASRLHSYCYAGDWVCDFPGTGVDVHDNAYGTWTVATLATQFILGKLGVPWSGGTGGSTSGGGGNQIPILSSSGLILQEIGQAGVYTGPVDGVPGTYTWRGVQQVVKGYGYTGPIDGGPAPPPTPPCSACPSSAATPDPSTAFPARTPGPR